MDAANTRHLYDQHTSFFYRLLYQASLRMIITLSSGRLLIPTIILTPVVHFPQGAQAIPTWVRTIGYRFYMVVTFVALGYQSQRARRPVRRSLLLLSCTQVNQSAGSRCIWL
ncbi:hypothetical protein B0T12DRAFT_401486 [Alternaria alternata]|nr:hypothetical protein B0T12DRAFT_401486 [Alternaria alternata]